MSFKTDFDFVWSSLGIGEVLGDLISYTPSDFNHPGPLTVSNVIAQVTQKYIESNGIENLYTVCIVHQSEWPDPGYNDWVEHDGVVYRVKGIQPDGTGDNSLILERS